MIKISQDFGINAKIIGRVEASKKKQLIIRTGEGEFIYN
jgi:hypothetical protein